MTKRLLAILLVMVMVFSMMPTSVWAEGTQPQAAHTHKVCNGSALCADCTHTDVTYEPLTDVSKLNTTSGNYYLTEDLILTDQINPAKDLDIKLCLNGFNIKAASGKNIRFFNVNNNNVKLTISNCGEKKNEAGVQKGVVTGAKEAILFAGNKSNGSKIAFYHVIFDNNSGATGAGSNSTIQVNSNAALTAVACDFTNNYSRTAGAIRLYGAGTVELVGCTLTGNRGRYGYALRVNKGTVNLTDTVIENNYSSDATIDSGAVEISPEGSSTVGFTVQGLTKIYGNSNKTTADGTGAARDLFLKNATKQPKVKIGAKGLADDAKIGVYLPSADRLVNDPCITDALGGKNYSKNFIANNAGYQISMKNDRLEMEVAVGESHTHKVCNGNALCADCAHTNVTYEPLTDVSKLNTTSGNYYLTEDLILTDQINPAKDLDIKICLNGFNIKAASGKNIRFFNVNNNNVKLTVSNCGEKKNEAGVQKGVVTGATNSILFAGNSSTGSKIEFYNVIFDNNTGAGDGGTGSNSTMQINSNAALTAVGCDFTNNYSNTAGVIRLYGAGAVELVGCTLTGNRGKYGYALRADNGRINLTDTVIENNYSTDATVDSGAVQISPAGNSTVKFTVNGQTKILGNSNKTTADGTGVARNLYLKQATKQAKVTVGTLSAEAKIGVTLQAERLTAEDTRYFSDDLADKNPAGFFVSDDDAYMVVRKAGKLFLDSKTNAHKHALCYVTGGCACGNHDDLIFSPWGDTDAEKTSLPKSGNYYLTSDVTLKHPTDVETADLNLCLNGHTVKAPKNDRILVVTPGRTLSVTDCTGDGIITGGVRNYGGVINVNQGAIFNLYGGNLTDNSTLKLDGEAGKAGAIYLTKTTDGQPGGVFNMYGGTVSENKGFWGGAVFVCDGATANIYGGTIAKNEAKGYGGAFYVDGKGTVNICGGTISENAASRGSALYVCNGAELNISGGIIENHASNALRLVNNSTATMSGGTIRNNNGGSGGAVLLESRSKMTMSGGEITGNTGTNGGVFFVSINCVFNMTGGVISDNTAKASGGGVHLLRATFNMSGGEIKNNISKGTGGGVHSEGAVVNVTGGKITGNQAVNGAGIYLSSAAYEVTENGEKVKKTQQSSACLADGEITGNVASNTGGGVVTKDANFEKLELSGDMVIADNRANNKTSNLYLPGKAVFSVNAMGENAKVGVSTERVYGSVSQKTDSDCSAAFFSDNSAMKVIYKDETVYLQAAGGHTHCVCLDQAPDCKHEATAFAPWSDPTKLPTSGNFYLTCDVKLKLPCTVTAADLNLCLNGHTVTAPKNERTLVANPGVTLSVTDCTDKGAITGGIRNYGGVINVNQGATFNLYGGNLTGNRTVKMTGEAGKAGAVYLTKATDGQPGAVFNMYGGSITENKTFWGGAIYVCDGATMNLYGGTIANNEAMDRAGAICGDGKAVINLYGGTITDNTAAKGGAIYVRNGSHINMAGAVITKNKTNATVWEEKQIAKASGGAAIALTNQSTMTMSGGEISYNEAKGAGGAIIVESKDTKFTLTGGKFIGNTTTSDGGAIYISRNTIFEMSGGEFTKNNSKNGGALYFLQPGSATISGGVVSENTVKTNGGGIYILQGEVTITDIKVTKNVATNGSGAGIAMTNSTLNLKGGSISYNRCLAKGGKGGAIMMNGCTLNMTGGSIHGNSLHEKSAGGAAICTSYTTITKDGVKQKLYSRINMYGGTISGHTGRNGGALLLQSKTVMNMYGGTMRDNLAKVEGGAVTLYSESVFNMSGGTMRNNKSEGRGGAVKVNPATSAVFTGGTATGNYAVNYGGFINAHGIDAKLTVKNMKIYGNECEEFGGGIAVTWNAILDMDDCEFYENKAHDGGGMYLAHKTTCYVDDVKVYKNEVVNRGGGLYLDVGNNINLTNVKIMDNESANNGGGIYSRANVHFKDCLISGNVSATEGGGIATGAAWTYQLTYTNGYVGRGQGLILENTKFDGNSCVGRGGGAFMAKKNWNEIINCEFTNNTCGEMGSGLFAGDDLLINGLTATGNTSKSDGYAVYFRENTFDGQSYVQSMCGMGGNVIVKDNVGGDMMLCDKIVVNNIAEGYGEDTYFNVTLSDGVLTNRLLGEYNYEGGDLNYTVTYGSRSYTEPEVDPAYVIEEEQTTDDSLWLYVGLGAFVAVIAAAVVLIVVKKKKAGKPAEAPQE